MSEPPVRGELGATYAIRLRLIGKPIVNFLLVIIELFSLGAFIMSQFMCVTDGQTDRRLGDQKDRVAYNAAR